MSEYELKTIPDELLDSVFYTPGLKAVERLSQAIAIGARLLESACEEWSEDSRLTAPYIHAASLAAAQPAFEALALGRRPNREHAREVSDNFQALSDVISQPIYANPTNTHVIGRKSECAITGLLWWGIDNGMLPENSYVKPATHAQDMSTHPGLRNGVDLFLCRPRQKSLKIQVKTRGIMGIANTYEGNIKVVATADIAQTAHRSTDIILRALANNNQMKLMRYCSKINTLIATPGKKKTTILDTSKYRDGIFPITKD